MGYVAFVRSNVLLASAVISTCLRNISTQRLSARVSAKLNSLFSSNLEILFGLFFNCVAFLCLLVSLSLFLSSPCCEKISSSELASKGVVILSLQTYCPARRLICTRPGARLGGSFARRRVVSLRNGLVINGFVRQIASHRIANILLEYDCARGLFRIMPKGSFTIGLIRHNDAEFCGPHANYTSGFMMLHG